MKTNNLWLNVKGDYINFVGKILYTEITSPEFDLNFEKVISTEFGLFFDAS